MKKVISLMLALVLALSLTACGGKTGPEGVVGQFCKGLQELDEKAIAQCFENGDDLELSELEDVDSDDAVAQKIMDFMKSCAGRLKYQVGEATVDGDTATVPVEFTYVNAGSLMTEILTEYISQAWSLALSGADDEKLAAAFEEVFDEKTTGADFPTLTATLTIPCVQTSDGWKISSSADNSEDLSAQLLDILTSNIYGALEDFGAGLLGYILFHTSGKGPGTSSTRSFANGGEKSKEENESNVNRHPAPAWRPPPCGIQRYWHRPTGCRGRRIPRRRRRCCGRCPA